MTNGGIRRSELPRLIIYHQTTHDSVGRPISILPLINKQHIALTHLIVAAFHINANRTVHLNDFPHHHALFHTLWNETCILQSTGIKVLGIVGGAAAGSFTRYTLDGNTTTFESSYAALRDAITAHSLDGIDLDVEEPMTQRGITRLIRRLRSDFGRDFIITLAPVAAALAGWDNLSGFNYGALEREVGREIAFYNTQFYSSFGSMRSTADFDEIVDAGPVHGTGFVPHERLGQVIAALMRKYGVIGGIMGWEYFNGVPGGERQPWKWAEAITAMLRPKAVPVLSITREMAERLREAWILSAAAGKGAQPKVGVHGAVRSGTAAPWARSLPNIDYLSMVTA
ncbi:hypothetical protein C8A03DRAFT_44987 [Achaetomium macrosporum]|uniref:GH18 domain-containing protein n=1 Tax=Achaetomium macrosporum TaxID=79813 RepID=A0AAN7C800_9PEZI|nr:hypothetical protein C8A03DRAFT_44987 [Achaetomium macrosporum]